MKIKKLRHRYNKLSSRLIFTIILAVVICFSVFTFRVSTTIAEAEIKRFEHNTEQLSRYIGDEMSKLIQQINGANSYYELSLMTASSKEEEQTLLLDGLQYYSHLTESIFLINSPLTRSDVSYYKSDTKEELISLEPDFSVEQVLDKFSEMSPYDTQFMYFDPSSKKLFAVKKLYQTATQEQYLLGIELNTSVFSQYLDNPRDKGFGNMGITSENGIIMAHSDSDLVGQSIEDLSLGNDIVDQIAMAIANNEQFQQNIDHSLSQFEMVTSEDHTFMYIPIPIDNYGTTWGIIVDISRNVLRESSLNIAKTIVLGGLFTLLILTILIKTIVRHGLKPIDDIMAVMKEIENGNLNARTSIASCNEMEVIGNRLNDLLDHMIDDRQSILKQKNEIEELLIEVENLMQENDRIYYETIKSLAKTIDAKDKYTGGHCDRVTEYALYIGKEMGLSQDKLSSLTYGAMLHDIGKIGIPESIITKEGRLTDSEFDAIKTHPEKGFEILKDINFLKEARLGVLHHHERYDGKGYPHGLAGEAIDMNARIIAIADAFDAMTSDRSYRKALSVDAAVNQLINNKALQFDPQMVDILVKGINTSQVSL